MLCGYIGTHEFGGDSIFCGDAFGRFGMSAGEDWWQVGEVSEGGWVGWVFHGGIADVFHELHAVLDVVLWSRVLVLEKRELLVILYCWKRRMLARTKIW